MLSLVGAEAVESEGSTAGELLFALSFLPTAERLSLVLSKAKLLPKEDGTYPARKGNNFALTRYAWIGRRLGEKLMN